jgi:hypothetical protein
VCVSRVEPAFVQILADLGEADLDAPAASWAQKLSDLDAGALKDLLRQMTAFARQAREAAKPVLQLDLL